MAETVGNTKTFRLFNESVLAVTNHLDAVIPTGVFHTGVDTEIFIMAGFCLLATKNLTKIPHCVRNDILDFIIVRIFLIYIELTLFIFVGVVIRINKKCLTA